MLKQNFHNRKPTKKPTLHRVDNPKNFDARAQTDQNPKTPLGPRGPCLALLGYGQTQRLMLECQEM